MINPYSWRKNFLVLLNSGPIWATKYPKTVYESSQKISLDLLSARETKNVIQSSKNGIKELNFHINTLDENLTIHITHHLTLKAQCGSCVWDIVTISVLSGVLLPWRICQAVCRPYFPPGRNRVKYQFSLFFSEISNELFEWNE